ncbi:MAG: class I tRNA ligase family protein, partial [Thermonemataceae bacterium]
TLPNPNKVAIDRFEAKLNDTLAKVTQLYETFRLSEALTTVYRLVWDEFCARYLEIIKPAYDQAAQQSLPIDHDTYRITVQYFDTLMRLLHPFMPFITEEVWQYLQPRTEGESICVASYPTAYAFDQTIIEEATRIFEIVQNINNIRQQQQLKKSEVIEVYFTDESYAQLYTVKFALTIQKLAGVGNITLTTAKPSETVGFIVGSEEFFIPVTQTIDVEVEKQKLIKELDYQKGFLQSVEKKLSNERFVSNAPEKVVALEKKNKEDAEAKIKALEESLAAL